MHDLLVGTLSIGIPSSKGVQKKSVKDGIENEELTIFSVWKKKMKKDGHEGLKVQSCIFMVSKSHGFLGVSADQVVTV